MKKYLTGEVVVSVAKLLALIALVAVALAVTALPASACDWHNGVDDIGHGVT